jgi:hypothetical protein
MNCRFDVRKNHRRISSIVYPNALDILSADSLLAEKSEFTLLIHKEEAAFDNGEATGSEGWRAHEFDHIVAQEGLTPDCVDNEAESTRGAVSTLLAKDLVEALGVAGILEDHTDVLLSLGFIEAKADAVLQNLKSASPTQFYLNIIVPMLGYLLQILP